jgi:hypothetical protein
LLFKKYLTEQDVLIYDTLYGNPEDVLTALEAYKKAKELSGEKTLILISGLGCWGKNDKKIKKEPVKEEENPEGQENQAEPPPPEVEPEKEKTPEADKTKKLGGFDDDDDEPPKKEESKVEEPPVEEKPAEPPLPEEEEVEKPPEYLPWTDKDFADRIPLDQ